MEQDINKMSLFELSRWCALVYAVNLIGEECEDRKLDFDKINLEPLYIRKYIDKISDDVARALERKIKSEKEKELYNFKNGIVKDVMVII
jgi:hypothetical protein